LIIILNILKCLNKSLQRMGYSPTLNSLMILFIMAILTSYSYADTDTLVLATVSPSDTNVYKVSEAVLTEALRRNNIKLVLEIYPPKRAELLVNLGKVDGDSHRINEFNKNNPDIIRVSEPVQSIRQSVFTKKLNFQVDGWKSLSPYKVIFVEGIRLAENEIRKAVKEQNLIPVDTIETSFKMLAKDRGELLITSPETGFATMKKLSLEKSGIKILTPPVTEIYLYTYLNKKHEKLASKISDSLKEMKADGFYQRIIENIAEK